MNSLTHDYTTRPVATCPKCGKPIYHVPAYLLGLNLWTCHKCATDTPGAKRPKKNTLTRYCYRCNSNRNIRSFRDDNGEEHTLCGECRKKKRESYHKRTKAA